MYSYCYNAPWKNAPQHGNKALLVSYALREVFAT